MSLVSYIMNCAKRTKPLLELSVEYNRLHLMRPLLLQTRQFFCILMLVHMLRRLSRPTHLGSTTKPNIAFPLPEIGKKLWQTMNNIYPDNRINKRFELQKWIEQVEIIIYCISEKIKKTRDAAITNHFYLNNICVICKSKIARTYIQMCIYIRKK